MKDISKGYIALFRQFIDWDWFTDINTCHLFIYCLLRANHKNTKWRGIELKKGQFVTSYQSLSEATGLSIRNVRTSLKKLTSKTTNELTHKTTNHYSIITVNNWNLYQKSDKQNDKQNDKQVTTDNKQINNSNISYINISLSEEERNILKKYIFTKKKNVNDADAYIRRLIDNGDIVSLLEKAKRWKQRQEEAKKEQERILHPPVEEVASEEEIKAAMERARKKIFEKK